MNKDELITQAKRLARTSKDKYNAGLTAEIMEFLRVYAGEKSAFYKNLSKLKPDWSEDYVAECSINSLKAFIRYIENGLLDGVSIERKAQIEVVSDFLDQANTLLNTSGVHPAAPAVIIGAALEEFLRTWIEEIELSLGGKKPSLDSFAKVLREAELISKQDLKDITSWSGLRNHAAHGEWEDVGDPKRVSLMLEGVNLFMRQYGKREK